MSTPAPANAVDEMQAVILATEPADRTLVMTLPPDGSLADAAVYYRHDDPALEAAAAEDDYDPRDRWFFLGGPEEASGQAPSSWLELVTRAERLGETVIVLHYRAPQPPPSQPTAEAHGAALRGVAACGPHVGLTGKVHAAVEIAWMHATGARR